jgi:alpha-amylase
MSFQTEKKLMLYFQVHQPKRLKTFSLFDIGSNKPYFNDYLNNKILSRIAHECYLPANELLLKLINRYPQIKVTFSVSGVILEQLEELAPEVVESFKRLAETGSVDFLAETYYHSLASVGASDEFETQVVMHSEKLLDLFGVRPTVFRNTELIYSNDIGSRVNNLGFRGVLTEGAENILKTRSAHQVYRHPEIEDLKLFLRNYHLSDDISFRFNSLNLTADKFIHWLEKIPDANGIVMLGMDYETFGEHKKYDCGIFRFLENTLTRLAHHSHIEMILPSAAVDNFYAADTFDVPHAISWADESRDLSAWLGNDMQRDAYESLMRLEHDVKFIDDPQILKQWRYLQSSDHFYYMSTKTNNDGVVHSYFSHYPSCYEAFMNFMNVYTDFSQVVTSKTILAEHEKQTTSALEAERRKLTTPVWAINLAAQGYHH